MKTILSRRSVAREIIISDLILYCRDTVLYKGTGSMMLLQCIYEPMGQNSGLLNYLNWSSPLPPPLKLWVHTAFVAFDENLIFLPLISLVLFSKFHTYCILLYWSTHLSPYYSKSQRGICSESCVPDRISQAHVQVLCMRKLVTGF